MTFFSRGRRRSGFTLVEVLIALAVIVILFAISIPSVYSIQTNLRMESLDATARQIFTAAQNRLAVLRSSGSLGTVGGESMPAMPQDFDESAWDWTTNNGNYYYLTKLESGALIPAGTLDDETDAGYYIIEYNAKTGSVYGVFYSKSTIDYTDDIVAMENRTYDYRKAQGGTLGYYGGTDIESADTEQVLAPGINLINGEDLYLEITPVSGKSYTYTVNIEGAAGNKSYSFSSESSGDVLNNSNITYSVLVGKYTVTLDSLISGLHFQELFPSSDGFVPGEDITVTVTTTIGDGTETPVSVSATANSLFARRNGDTADISSCRHLQNLSPAVSDVSVDTGCVTSAVQTAAIDWDEAAVATFQPITNPVLTSYDGCGNVIRNLSVQAASGDGYAGLFGNFGSSGISSAITDVRLANVSVAGGSASYVGALAGKTLDTDISSCMAYAVPAELTNLTECGVSSDLTGAAVQYVGGLVGCASGGSVTESMASLPLISVAAATSGSSPYVGGLLGYSDAPVSESYANTAEINVLSSTVTANIGGLAGGLDGGSADCYSMGAVSVSGGVAAGGFAGIIGDFDKDYVNCYSGMAFSGSGTNVTLSGFVFSSGAAADFTNCFCMSGTGYGDVGDSAVSAVSSSALATCLTSANWTEATEATTIPYTLTGAYPYPRLTAMSHYGDWTEVTGDTPMKIAYYEIYELSGGTYQIGFYSADIAVNGSGGTLNTLLDDGDYASLVLDGYIVMFEKDAGSSSCCGVSYANLTKKSDSYQIWNLNGTITTNNSLEKPSAITVDDNSSVSVYYDGSELTDGRVLTFSNVDYYPIFLSYTQVVNDGSNEETFYQKLTLGLNASGGGETGADTYDFYYNPHFAKSSVFAEAAPPESGISAYIRTERQYATLASTEYSRCWNKDVTFIQERDLNFASNHYSTSYFGSSISSKWRTQTLSIGTDSSYFNGTYNGGGYAITGLTITGNSNLGMFGRTEGAALKNVTLISPTVNSGGGTNGVNNSGCLAGYCSNTAISGVTIQGGIINGRYRIGAAVGTLANSCSVSGLTIDGGYVSAARLAGVIGQTVCDSDGASQTVQNISVTSLAVVTRDEATGLSVPDGASFGISAFIGDIYSESSSTSVSISNVALSGCSVTLDNLTSTGSKREFGALLVGTAYSKSGSFTLAFGSGISIANCNLYADADRAGDAFGVVIGQISSDRTWAMTAPAAAITGTSFSRSGAGSTSGNNIGGYIGAVKSGGGALTVNLPGTVDLTGVNYTWSSTSSGSNIGGCIGYVGSGTVIGSSSLSGTVVRHGGLATTFNTDGGTAGGFAGYSAGAVSDVSVRNMRIVTGTWAFTESGGFIGVIEGGSVTKCDARLETGYTNVSLAGVGNVGGFAGRISGGAAISYCFGSQDVSATQINVGGIYQGGNAGGFAAVVENGDISYAYASGDVSGNLTSGGFIGSLGVNGSADFPVVTDCYASKNVDGGGSAAAGGFVGKVYGGSINRSYSLGEVTDASNGSTGLGGFVGVVDIGAPSVYSSGTVLFSNVAYMHGGLTPYNIGYSDYEYTSYSSVIHRLTMTEFKDEALAPMIFAGMVSADSSHPYDTALVSFEYPAIYGAGCGITDAQQWGDWQEYEEITVPPTPSGTELMGVFRYERVSGTTYRIIAAGVNFEYFDTYFGSDVTLNIELPTFLDVTVDLADYLGTYSLSSAGYGIFWHVTMNTGGFMLDGTKGTYISDLTLGADLQLSPVYLFHPLGARSSTNLFGVYHDNGHSGKNLDATYIYNTVSHTFSINAAVR